MKNKIFISLLPFETKRLIIRKTTVNDVNMLLKMDKQEKTQKYLGGIKNKTREERIAFIEKKLEKFDKGLAGQLTVCLKDGTSIGLIGLNIREENNTGEIGYIFDYDYCNKGYCTEACMELLKSSNCKEVYANTIKDNDSSKRVLEKLGFKKIKEDSDFTYYKIER
jgi:ribosomal-protein-alanine N-acetyltransferase